MLMSFRSRFSPDSLPHSMPSAARFQASVAALLCGLYLNFQDIATCRFTVTPLEKYGTSKFHRLIYSNIVYHILSYTYRPWTRPWQWMNMVIWGYPWASMAIPHPNHPTSVLNHTLISCVICVWGHCESVPHEPVQDGGDVDLSQKDSRVSEDLHGP